MVFKGRKGVVAVKLIGNAWHQYCTLSDPSLSSGLLVLHHVRIASPSKMLFVSSLGAAQKALGGV